MNNSILELINKIESQVLHGLLEPTNADLLIKLIKNADTLEEAKKIESMGTIFRPTGFYYDKRFEKDDCLIKYYSKNEKLSFKTDDNDLTHKLIIGDNYDALKNLLITHKGLIDVIYIDPPYGSDSLGNFAKTNYKNDITRDNLLSMLQPRLELAKLLLCDGGILFCSIDDKNQAYVKCLFDDVFGENNFIATYLWKKTDTPPSLSKKVRKKYEYVFCYGKNVPSNHQFSQGNIDGGDAPLIHTGNISKCLTFPSGTVHFNIADGIYKPNDNMRIQLKNEVVVKNGINENTFSAEGEWAWGQQYLNEEIEKGSYFIVKSNKFSVRYQKNNTNTGKTPPNNLDSELGVGKNEDAEKELKSILTEKVFDNPKPVSLIKFLIKMVNKEDDIVILDFFAGSGTTGQAVLELNKEDSGNRQFILCTNNEKEDGFIADNVTSKRLKRVMTGECYDGSKDFKWIKNNKPYGNNLDVYNIEKISATCHKGLDTPFDVIDETLYDVPKFDDFLKKIEWVCENFEKTQGRIQTDKEWINEKLKKTEEEIEWLKSRGYEV